MLNGAIYWPFEKPADGHTCKLMKRLRIDNIQCEKRKKEVKKTKNIKTHQP